VSKYEKIISVFFLIEGNTVKRIFFTNY